MKKVVFGLFVVLFFCTSCLDIVNEAVKSAKDNASKESLSVNNYVSISIDSLYKLDIPKYMKPMTSLHSEATLQYANLFKEAYTVVIHENKEDFISIFTEYNEYDSQLSPIENYAIVQEKMFKEAIVNFKIEHYGLTTINGYPAKQVKIFGLVDGIEAAYIIAFVEGKTNIFMLMNWTTKERLHKLENTFEFINGTFTLI